MAGSLTQNKRGLAYITAFLLLSFSTALVWVAGHNAYSGNHVLHGTLSFGVSFGDPVALQVISAERYGLGEDSDEEWSKTIPSGGHLVHVAKDASSTPEPYTVTLFHQLRCIGIIRAQYKLAPDAPISSRTEHCLNYLRQTILCKPNFRLESVDNEFGHTDHSYETVCRDWTALYREAERNQMAYEELSMERMQGRF